MEVVTFPPLALRLLGEDATLALGQALGAGLTANPGFAILLSGPLGAGKTTLVRGLVSALPGGGQARVASPSFTLANRYPTVPPVVHIDLYRLNGSLERGIVPEEVEDALDDTDVLAIVEWAERLPTGDWPESAVCLHLHHEGDSRLAEISSMGEPADAFLLQKVKLLQDLQLRHLVS